MRIAIDPGHGMGNSSWALFDPGAVCEGIREADINLAVALYLRDECGRRGWSSIMTRNDNAEAANLKWRVSRARSADADAMVSIHCNAASSPHAKGTETLYLGAQWVAVAVQRQLVQRLGLRDRGAKQRDDLAVLRFERPAILCELGFLTNRIERGLLCDPEFQRRASIAIADGLAETIRP